MKVRLIIILNTITVLLSSCATARDSVLLGMGAGAAFGAGIGAMHGQSDRSELRSGAVGAATGALFGGIMGYLAHRGEAARKLEQTNSGDNAPTPSLTKPVVRRVWTGDKVEGDKLIRGHWIYILEKNSEWRN